MRSGKLLVFCFVVFSTLLRGVAAFGINWNEVPIEQKSQTTVAFGACIFEPNSPAWKNISALHPDLFLLLGDNIYLRDDELGDFNKTSQRYELLRSQPDFRELQQAVKVFAVWDDHDFGPKDSNKSFGGKTESLKAFFKHWNQNLVRPFKDSIATAIRIGKVKIILGDNRSFRDDPSHPDAEHFGKKQLDWISSLVKDVSQEEFLVFASGGQLLSPAGAHYETLGHYPREQAHVTKLLSEAKSPVVILSGDRHYAEVLNIRLHGRTIWELTSSPLSAVTAPPEYVTFYPERAFTFHPQKNFGLLRIDWQSSGPRAWVEYYSDQGKLIIRYELTNLS